MKNYKILQCIFDIKKLFLLLDVIMLLEVFSNVLIF